jgi:ferrous iron transport protein B
MNQAPSTQLIKQTLKVALVGNPNAGKSSVFNRLTGLNQQVGNFPGVTVDKKTGHFRIDSHTKALAIDLPGLYSLYPDSPDEKIVLDVLADPGHALHPDVVIYVMDATNLERHLLLLTQLMDLQLPVVVALNMMDVAKEQGLDIDAVQLGQLLGVPCLPVNGRTGEGLELVKQQLALAKQPAATSWADARAIAPAVVAEIAEQLPGIRDYKALLMAHHIDTLHFLSEPQRKNITQIRLRHGFQPLKAQVSEIMARYDRIVPIAGKVAKKLPGKTVSFSEKADHLLTHPVYGILIFLSILFLVFQAIFAWASYPMDLIEGGFGALNHWLKDTLPPGLLTDMLTDGVISGLSGVLMFIPQITLLFLMIAILEEFGYMSRVVFLSDGIMRRFGLNGRSIVSLISGAACAIPAIMATRTIGNWKERLTTIFVTPFISCSARIPVFTVLVAFAVPETYLWGWVNLQGLAIMGLYLLGVAAALLSGILLRKLLKARESSYFLLELPTYKMPHWKNVAFTVYEKVRTFVLEAGRVIMVIAMILWALASFGPPGEMERVTAEVMEVAGQQGLSQEATDNMLAAQKIEVSFAGYLGKHIEPLIRPLGFDWKIGIALIASFAAREVFVGTMATIYSVGSADDETSVVARMRTERNEDGRLVYTPATSASLLIYYLFAMQCMSTLAVVKRETKSWKWPVLQALYMTGLAYIASLLVYNLLR